MTLYEISALKRKSKELIKLNDSYHKYLYLSEIKSIDHEKERIKSREMKLNQMKQR